MENIKKRGFKRKSSAIAAIVLILALCLAGTFAWSLLDAEVNNFDGKYKDIELIDDYNPETGDKNVGAKNIGKTPLFVRISLDQWMEILNDLDVWEDIMGNTNGWIVDRDTNPDGEPDDEWWTHNDKLNPINPTTGNPGDDFNKFWKWIMGGSDTDYAAKYPGSPAVGVVLTYADWVTTKPANVWVYCDDGYFYWSSMLAPGATTGLLLNQVDSLPALDKESYYYAINALLESVDIKDINTWLKGGTSKSGHDFDEVTEDAKVVLINARGPLTVSSFKAIPAITEFDKGEAFDATGLTLELTLNDGTTEIADLSTMTEGTDYILDPASGTILGTAGTVTVTVKFGGKTGKYTITVKSTASKLDVNEDDGGDPWKPDGWDTDPTDSPTVREANFLALGYFDSTNMIVLPNDGGVSSGHYGGIKLSDVVNGDYTGVEIDYAALNDPRFEAIIPGTIDTKKLHIGVVNGEDCIVWAYAMSAAERNAFIANPATASEPLFYMDLIIPLKKGALTGSVKVRMYFSEGGLWESI